MQPVTQSASSRQAQRKLLPWAERAEGQEIPGASPGPEAGLGGEFQAHPATCWTWDMGCELDSFLLSCAP